MSAHDKIRVSVQIDDPNDPRTFSATISELLAEQLFGSVTSAELEDAWREDFRLRAIATRTEALGQAADQQAEADVDAGLTFID